MHKEKVRSYFDDLAEKYAHRLGPDSPFLAYYFQQRLRIACAELSLTGKHILDVGAGTGACFDFLKSNQIDLSHYLALDISAGMLAQSQIPPAQRMVGDIEQLSQLKHTFDYIFLLGVSSYMPISELEQVLHFANRHLRPAGQLIISFTYRSGLDFQIRKILSPILRQIIPGRGVIQQAFPITAMTPKEVQAMGTSQLVVSALRWLPPVIPGLHHLFPKWAIKVSGYLSRTNNKPDNLKLLRTDFVTFWVKVEPDV